MENQGQYSQREVVGNNQKNILMILQSEILKIAEKEGVPPEIDKNWVFLRSIFLSE